MLVMPHVEYCAARAILQKKIKKYWRKFSKKMRANRTKKK